MLNKLVAISIAFGAVALANSQQALAQDRPTPQPVKSESVGNWGNLVGQIVVSGEPPKPIPEDLTDATKKDLSICIVDGKAPFDDGIVINQKNQLRDVFILMYVGRGATTPKELHPSYAELKKDSVSLVIQNSRFIPHAISVRSGQTLKYINNDDTSYNCPLTSFMQEHSLNVPNNSEVELVLDSSSDMIPGEIRCDIHKWMDAVVLIRDNPYVAISNDEGKFRIENIPAGTWQFQFWHKKVGFLKTLDIEDYKVNRRGVIGGVQIKNGETLDLGELTLPSAAFSVR